MAVILTSEDLGYIWGLEKMRDWRDLVKWISEMPQILVFEHLRHGTGRDLEPSPALIRRDSERW